eukprot:TRINITY_DN76164_c0_g1_i1.p1 TRINITY_DN76164_c0_g1~~TRINITY_DN76164_c0_g1_i1.p1  ORF type:complete len:604 (+),score=117.82 TRINITY_DN76164_c0_g1_i1:59-1870(+)
MACRRTLLSVALLVALECGHAIRVGDQDDPAVSAVSNATEAAGKQGAAVAEKGHEVADRAVKSVHTGALTGEHKTGGLNTDDTHARSSQAIKANAPDFKFSEEHDPTPKCSSARRLAPVFAVAIPMMLVVAWFAYKAVGRSPSDTACFIGLLPLFSGSVMFMLPVMDTYKMSMALGWGAGLSGIMLGIFNLGVVITEVAVWFVLSKQHDFWKNWSRSVIIWSHCLCCIGSLIYAGAGFVMTIGYPEGWNDRLAYALLFGRVVIGAGFGSCLQLLMTAFPHLTPSLERPAQMVQVVLAFTLGVGLGPMAAALANGVNFCPAHVPRYEVAGLLMLVVSLASLVGVALFFPCLDKCTDYLSQSETQVVEHEADAAKSRSVIIGSLLMKMNRTFVVSGLEVATTVILEVDFGWSCETIGLALGGIFVCVLPVKFLFEATSGQMSMVAWVRLLSFCSTIGTVMLFTGCCAYMHLGANSFGCAFTLLVGNAILFPTLNLGDGLCTGMLQQFLRPHGSWFDANHVALWQAILCDGISRVLGPWLAREEYEKRGQNGCALQLLAMCPLFILVFETMVCPHVQESNEEPTILLQKRRRSSNSRRKSSLGSWH